ncbi:hypothetical protein ACRASX_16295 (plasmid) [Flavobacterium sp. TMP13]|uniref:hypothetical protein n=1 Tax=Flavobacterium sp. TMP13 TaxID=3425950 RepID=UPI003D78ABED
MSDSNLISEDLAVNLQFKYLPTLFIFDQIIRFGVLFLYLKFSFQTWVFITLQIILLISVGIYSDKKSSKIKRKYLSLLSPSYTSLSPEVIIEENIPKGLMGYQMLFGYIYSFWFFYYIFDNHEWYHYILIIFLSFFGLVFCILTIAITPIYKVSRGAQNVTVIKRKTISELGKPKILTENVTVNYPQFFQSGVNIEPDNIEFDTIDLNDTKIAKLESEVKNITYKAEAWLLESVFLGGLAFSGFLTVASANFIGKETEAFQTFLDHILSYLQSCEIDDITSWYNHIATYFYRNDLYILIMLLCLLSSVFFLLILTLRLRLNVLTLNLDHLLRISTIFNAKEEEIFNSSVNLENNPNQVARFGKIQRKIEMALDDAERLLLKIKPVSMMMNLFRTIAIVLFYVVLILSGFYFKPIIAVGIFGLALFSFLFRKIETYLNINEIKRRLKRH